MDKKAIVYLQTWATTSVSTFLDSTTTFSVVAEVSRISDPFGLLAQPPMVFKERNRFEIKTNKQIYTMGRTVELKNETPFSDSFQEAKTDSFFLFRGWANVTEDNKEVYIVVCTEHNTTQSYFRKKTKISCHLRFFKALLCQRPIQQEKTKKQTLFSTALTFLVLAINSPCAN